MGLFSWAFGVDAENANRAQQADAQLAALNQQRYADGKMSLAELEARKARLANSADYGYDSQIWGEFKQGAKEGALTMQTSIRDTINGLAKFVLFSVPWWLWIAGIIGLLWWLGWLKILRR